MKKVLKTASLASLAAVCVLVSCGGNNSNYTSYEKTAREYIAANADSYALFDVSGNNFTWTSVKTATAYDAKYKVVYDFKTDTGTIYLTALSSGAELEAKFVYTYNWEYDAEADTEGVGPVSFEYTEFVKGSAEQLDRKSSELVPGFYYGELLGISYGLEGTAIEQVKAAYELATATPAE